MFSLPKRLLHLLWRPLRDEEPQHPTHADVTELIYLNGEAVRVPSDRPMRYHPDGVPVGMKPGDPLEPGQLAAIFTYVERQGITRQMTFSYRSPDSLEEDSDGAGS